MNIEQQRALAIARARVRARQKQANAPKHPEFDGSNIPGYNPATGEVDRTPQVGQIGAAVLGATDVATFGLSDEIAAGLSALGGSDYSDKLAQNRAIQEAAQAQNPWTYGGSQIAGGITAGLAAAPLTASAKFAGSTLWPRVAAGAADGAIFGGAYGAGSGEGAAGRATEAATGAGLGAAAGAAFPLVSAGASKAYETIRNALMAKPIATQAGATPGTLRQLGSVMEADGSLGPQGQANMNRAGADAMLADAGPNARAVLDTAIQRGGPGAVVARNNIAERTARSSQAIMQALDDTLGKPQGVTAARTSIRTNSAAARSSAYDDAYKSAIDYADPLGQEIEKMVKTRVPKSAIDAANVLMRTEGNVSKQILAKVADDGSVAFEKLPDVRQLDYITRGLNEVADQADGQGVLGGTTATGRAYQNLSKEIRDNLRDLVPEYGKALETAADPIRRSKAVELGSKLLSPGMTRDQVGEAVKGMTAAEKSALAQGVRSRLDDVMANVTRTVQDGDTTAREALKALKDLSSRANQEKLSLAIGDGPAKKLFEEIDQAATSFELRASVAENSKTYARLATDQGIKDRVAPGPISRVAAGEPINAAKRVVQALTGQTPEKLRGREDAIYSELATLLTRQGGAGQTVYDALGQLGQTDQATRLMTERIARALLGPQFSYPLSTQSANTRRQ